MPILAEVQRRNAGENEFHQAVTEVLGSLGRVVAKHPHYANHALIERLCEPERQIIFRVPWVDDTGQVRINRASGSSSTRRSDPYKGGLRFHPSVNVEIKAVRRGRIAEYARLKGATTHHIDGGSIWDVPCDVAMPCATQNELTGKDARTLVRNGVAAVGEGANMPCTPEAVRIFQEAGVLFGPGKAANAGGVATSVLEMQQNASRDS